MSFRIKVVDPNFPGILSREDNNYVLFLCADGKEITWETDDLILVLLETLKYQKRHKTRVFSVERVYVPPIQLHYDFQD